MHRVFSVHVPFIQLADLSETKSCQHLITQADVTNPDRAVVCGCSISSLWHDLALQGGAWPGAQQQQWQQEVLWWVHDLARAQLRLLLSTLARFRICAGQPAAPSSLLASNAHLHWVCIFSMHGTHVQHAWHTCSPLRSQHSSVAQIQSLQPPWIRFPGQPSYWYVYCAVEPGCWFVTSIASVQSDSAVWGTARASMHQSSI